MQPLVNSLIADYIVGIRVEFGRGTLKKDHVSVSWCQEEIHWMTSIKGLFDPTGILHPSNIL